MEIEEEVDTTLEEISWVREDTLATKEVMEEKESSKLTNQIGRAHV